MLGYLLHEYRRRCHKLPKTVTGHWLAGDYEARENDRSDREPRTDLDYFDDKGSYIDYSRGDEVVLFEESGYKAVYEIADYCEPDFADTLPWDDARKYDFIFKRLEYTKGL